MVQGKKAVNTPVIKESKACPIPPKLGESPIDDILLSQGFFSSPTQLFFNLGKSGMILLTLSIPSFIIIYMFRMIGGEANPFLDYILNFPPGSLTLSFTISCWLIAFGIMLTGLTFYGYWRYSHSKIGFAASIFFSVSPWWIIAADTLNYSGLVLDYNVLIVHETGSTFPSQGPFYFPFISLVILGIVFLTITMILWVSTTIRLQQQRNYRIVVVSTIITCSISIVFLLFYLFIWILMLIIPYPCFLYSQDIPIVSNLSMLLLPEEFFFVGYRIFGGVCFYILPALIISLIFYREAFQEKLATYPSPKPLKKDTKQIRLHTLFLIIASFILLPEFSELIINCFLLSSQIDWLVGNIPIISILAPIPPILVVLNWYKLKNNPDFRILALSYIIPGIEMIFLGYSFSIFIAIHQPGPHPANLYFRPFMQFGIIFVMIGCIVCILHYLLKQNEKQYKQQINQENLVNITKQHN